MRRLLPVLPVLVGSAAMPVPSATAGGMCFQPATEGRTATVRLVHACFSPTVAQVRPGTTVRWVNQSGLTHNVTGPGGWIDDLPDGTAAARLFRAPGLYPYACTLHVGMTGVVVVGDATGAPPEGGSEGRGVTRIDPGPPADSAAAAEQAVQGDATRPEPQPIADVSKPATERDPMPVGGTVAAAALVVLAAALAVRSARRRTAEPELLPPG